MATAAMPAIGAGISAVGNIGSSIAGNVANKNMAQMNNQFNERMLQKQMDYNTEMYNRQLGDQWSFYNDQKEYNSAPAQVDRLKQAGLNPALMMQGQGAGSVSSVSSPSAQGINPPTATPYSQDYAGYSQALGNALDAAEKMQNLTLDKQLKTESINQVRIENQYRAQKLLAEINEKIANTDNAKARTTEIDTLLMLRKGLLQTQNSALNADIEVKKADAKLKISQALINDKHLSFMDEQNKMQLADISAGISLKYQQGLLTKNQAEHEIQKQAETVARTSLTKQENENAKQQIYGMQLEQRFQNDTYNARVRLIKNELIQQCIQTVNPLTYVPIGISKKL